MTCGATIADWELLLETALHVLHLEFLRVNQEYLEGYLRPPAFSLHWGTSRLGFWHPARRVVSIALDHLLSDPWSQVEETLRHELAHMAAREGLEAWDQPSHGDAFRYACKVLRIPSRASISRRGHGDDAWSVAVKTDELRRRYVDLLESLGDDVPRDYLFLGRLFSRIPAEQNYLARAVQSLCGVELIWMTVFDGQRERWARCLQVCGTESSLMLAKRVHSLLAREAEQRWALVKLLLDGPTRKERSDFISALFEVVCERHERQPLPAAERGGLLARDTGPDQWRRRGYCDAREFDHPNARRRTEAWSIGALEGNAVEIHAALSDTPATMKSSPTDDKPSTSQRQPSGLLHCPEAGNS